MSVRTGKYVSHRFAKFDAHADNVSVWPDCAVKVHDTLANPPVPDVICDGVAVPDETVNRTRAPWTATPPVSVTWTVSVTYTVGRQQVSVLLVSAPTKNSSYAGPVPSPLHAPVNTARTISRQVGLFMIAAQPEVD